MPRQQDHVEELRKRAREAERAARSSRRTGHLAQANALFARGRQLRSRARDEEHKAAEAARDLQRQQASEARNARRVREQHERERERRQDIEEEERRGDVYRMRPGELRCWPGYRRAAPNMCALVGSELAQRYKRHLDRMVRKRSPERRRDVDDAFAFYCHNCKHITETINGCIRAGHNVSNKTYYYKTGICKRCLRGKSVPARAIDVRVGAGLSVQPE